VRWILALVALGALGVAAPAAAGPYARDARVDAVGRALASVRALGPQGRATLEQQLYEGARTGCRAGLGVPPLACLIDMARKTCEGRPPGERDGCQRVADVLITNALAETELVAEGERMRLLASASDFRAALRERLARRYAGLAADLALTEPGSDADLPARIDRFCADRDHLLAWQRCAAALIWWIGGHPGGTKQ
jgi:hypothetical protein